MIQSQKILITGANGYLGAQCSQYLALMGHKVTALCYPIAPEVGAWSDLMEEVLVGSVAEKETLELLKDRSFDTIIHLVSLDHHQSQSVAPDLAIQVNVTPGWNLLELFSKKGLKKFIYFSTIHVYGSLPESVITEEQILNPGNVYALTHSMTEQICNYYNRTSTVNCLTVRLSNSYGHPVFSENNCWWLAVNDLCRTAYKDKAIRLLSDGSPQRDFIHGSDVCKALAILCEDVPKSMEHNTYHISSSQTFTLLELAGFVKEVYKELYGEDIPVSTPNESSVVDFKKFSDKQRYKIDNSALQNLGFVPQCDLKEGIRKLFHYFEDSL